MPQYGYLDASAIVKLARREHDTEAVERLMLEYDGFLSSRLSEVEVARATDRNPDRQLLQKVDEVFEAIVLVDVTRPILERAAAVAPRDLRSLDAIHLATALALNIPDLDFITYDARLARAARAHGLTVP
jgi:predicted nucleic acid-binding protein